MAPRAAAAACLAVLTASPVASAAWCSQGVQSDGDSVRCCAASCGACGGFSCSTLPGGAAACCKSHLDSSARCCNDDSDTACLVPGPGVTCTVQSSTTTTTSRTTTAGAASQQVSDSGGNAAAIGGAVGGSVAFVILVAGCALWLRRRRTLTVGAVTASPKAGGGNSDAFVEELRLHLSAPFSAGELRAEIAAFAARGGPALGGQESAAAAGADAVATFQGCGRMGQMSTLIGRLERLEGCSIREIRFGFFVGGLQQAADQRLIMGASECGQGGGDSSLMLLYVLLCAKELRATDAGEFSTAAELYCTLKRLPEDWDVRQMLASYGCRMLSKQPMGDSFVPVFQQLLDDTFHAVKTRDRKGGLPKRFVVTSVAEVKNAQYFVEYCARRSVIAAETDKLDTALWTPGDVTTTRSSACQHLPELDRTLNEAWLFHGCTEKAAEGITTTEFRLDLAGTGAGCLYGPGIYLAECSTKSDEYAGSPEVKQRFMLVCRAVLGNINYTDKVDNDADELVRSCLSGSFHSVLGDRAKCRGTYREFVVFDNDQVYPAYIVEYRQEF